MTGRTGEKAKQEKKKKERKNQLIFLCRVVTSPVGKLACLLIRVN